MKSFKQIRKFVLRNMMIASGVAAALFSSVAKAQGPVSSAFTYQGKQIGRAHV